MVTRKMGGDSIGLPLGLVVGRHTDSGTKVSWAVSCGSLPGSVAEFRSALGSDMLRKGGCSFRLRVSGYNRVSQMKNPEISNRVMLKEAPNSQAFELA